MKKKVWLLIVLGLLIVIGIGGKVFVDNQRDREVTRVQKVEGKLIEAERMSVAALKNTFADIRSVEFEKTAYNEKTGSYRMFVKMTNQKNESVKFSFSFSKESPSETGGYVVEDEEIQVEGVTTNTVQVIFSNKVEGEV
jgi:hypothetical protein